MKNNFGIGFDAHKLVNNGNLTIGGVVIDKRHSLEGDSDGDVLIHAIIDSLLGAAGLGDIGHFFNKDNGFFWTTIYYINFHRKIPIILRTN